MQEKDILTIDVDWASDDIIEDIAAYLLKNKVKATWFVTHDSPAIRDLKDYPDYFERGIHPNFFEGSSQGKTYEEVLDFCMDIVPEAISTRSHGVYQHGRLMSDIVQNTPIKIDSTTFLPEMAGICAVNQSFTKGSIIKAPFFWADDYEICLPQPFQKIDRLFDVNGLRIYMFHPIHVALNTTSWDGYQKDRNYKSALKRLEGFSGDKKEGVTGMFTDLVEHLSESGGGFTLKSILED